MNRLTTITMCVASLLAPCRVPAVGVTDSVFRGGLTSEPNRFFGATFVPSVAPPVTVVHQVSTTVLTWSPVTFTGGGMVNYVVRRISPNGATVVVCSGADSPILRSDGLMQCTDTGSGGRRNLSYSEQPIAVRDGISTWTLEPSVPARGN